MPSVDVGRFEPEHHEFYCWAPGPDEEGKRTQWYVRDAADDSIVAGPFDIDTAISESARRNAALGDNYRETR